MEQLFLIAYFIILGVIIKTYNIVYILLWLLFGAIVLILLPVYKNIIKKSIQEHIKYTPNTPVININKAPWWQIEELPHITRVMAKKVVWIRNHNGLYSSKEDFFEKNNIKKEDIKFKISPLIYC